MLAPKPPDFPTTSKIITEIVKFLKQKKLVGNDIDYLTEDTVYIITARATNSSIEFKKYINNIEIPDSTKVYLAELYNLVSNLRDGENMYNYEHILKYSDELNYAILNHERKILNSGVEGDEMILPLSVVSVLKSSIIYYKAIYDAGGTTVEETNFKKVLHSTIGGSVIGAVEAFRTKETYSSIIAGCIAGSIGASLNNSWGQELWINTSPAKLPLEY